MEVRVEGDAEMAREAERFLNTLKMHKAATIITLSGELGAGKTTFARALARALGVSETVASPTFVIQKIYELTDRLWKKCIHIDAYRLKGASELYALGWDEIAADPSNCIILEWPERVEDAIPPYAQRVSIDIGEGETRVIRYG